MFVYHMAGKSAVLPCSCQSQPCVVGAHTSLLLLEHACRLAPCLHMIEVGTSLRPEHVVEVTSQPWLNLHVMMHGVLRACK